MQKKQRERDYRKECRCVEEADQNRQALLETYCAVVIGTPYNDFGTTSLIEIVRMSLTPSAERHARPLLERVGSGLRHLRVLIGRDPGHADAADDRAA